jgi:hypothetical protein
MNQLKQKGEHKNLAATAKTGNRNDADTLDGVWTSQSNTWHHMSKKYRELLEDSLCNG